MNGKANDIKKEFTNNHRRTYTNYNSSNIFNADIVTKENDLVMVNNLYIIKYH